MASVAQTPLAFRSAVEARDIAALRDAFRADAVLRSPNSDRLKIEGRDQIAVLYEVLFEVLEGLHFTDELRGPDSAVLIAKAHVEGTELEVADHLSLDEDGRVRVLTVFFRPLPAVAVAQRALGAALGRRDSPARGRLIRLLASPLVYQTRGADRTSERLLAPEFR